jgi:hypothetical protein
MIWAENEKAVVALHTQHVLDPDWVTLAVIEILTLACPET